MVGTPPPQPAWARCVPPKYSCLWQETSESWLVPTRPGDSQRTSHYLLCFHILR